MDEPQYMDLGAHPLTPSCPRIAVRRTASLRSPASRASTPHLRCQDVDGRDKPGHDDSERVETALYRGDCLDLQQEVRIRQPAQNAKRAAGRKIGRAHV